jgi:hypothetical protein
MFNKDTGGGTVQSTKQGLYTYEVQSEKPLTHDQLLRLSIIIIDAVRMTTGKAAYVVQVYK